MKINAILIALIFVVAIAFGFKLNVRHREIQSHCFVPGESHVDGVRPCVVVE